MGRGSGAFKFILIILVFYLLVHGSYAQNDESTDSDNSQLSEINGTITGVINGTINNTVDTNTGSEPKIIEKYEWLLLLPILYGNLLFLSWVSRFFDKMNFCFIIFILAALLMLLLFLLCSQNIPIGANNSSDVSFCSQNVLAGTNNLPILSYIFLITFIIAFLTVSLIIIIVLYSALFKRGKNENNLFRVPLDENCLVINLHDILRNFIIIFTGLMWPMILFYLYLNDINYITFFGIDTLEFPVYIIIASSIGILSYLFLSIEETFCQLIPEYKRISIAWSYLRRITVAPFIALIGFYLFNHLQNIEEATAVNDYFVFVFSFFAGIFTKTIEEWIYEWVQKLLPGDKKSEFEARNEYQIKESEFVKKLGFDEDLVYALYNIKVRSIEELAACDPENLKNRLNFDSRNLGEHMGLLLTEQRERFDSYSEQQVKTYINRASTYMNWKKEVEELVKSGKISIEEAYKLLCDCSEEKIKEFKEKAQERLESGKKELELEKKELELEKKELELEKKVKSSRDRKDED